MLVRFYAGAAEAAGADEERLDLPAGATGRDLVASLAEGRPRLARVLACSTLLVDGVRLADPAAELGPAARVDVLPPFAGG